jgi:hypothetical protein
MRHRDRLDAARSETPGLLSPRRAAFRVLVSFTLLLIWLRS